MELTEAIQLVEAHLRASPAALRHHLVIDHESTQVEQFGWVFFYNCKRYYESKDENTMLVGAAPLIVDRRSRKVIPTGTARPLAVYVDYYRRFGTLDGF